MSVSQEIKGNTLKVYLYLLRHGASELRDVQRGVGLSSASLASYHLGKLSEAGFVTQDELGRYLVVKEGSAKVLEGYSRMGSAIVPQFFFFALLFTILVAFFRSQPCTGRASRLTWWQLVLLWFSCSGTRRLDFGAG